MSEGSDDDDLWNFIPLQRRKTNSLHSRTSKETYSYSQNKVKTAISSGSNSETTSPGIKTEKDNVKIKTEKNTGKIKTEKDNVKIKTEKDNVKIKTEKNTGKIKTETLTTTANESCQESDAEYDYSFVQFRGLSNFCTPVKKNTNPSPTFNYCQIKNVKPAKKSSDKLKSTFKVKKKLSQGLSSLSQSTQATLSIENKKLIITPPKSSGYNTSKKITPRKPLLKYPAHCSVTKILPYFHCDSLSPHRVQKPHNTPSKLLNALNSEENLTYKFENNAVCSTQAFGSSPSLGNVSNSLKRKELGESSKRQLFLLDDSDDNESNKAVSKRSPSAISDIAKSHQVLFTPTDDKLSKSASAAQCLSDTESYDDTDFASPRSVPDSPFSSTCTIAFDSQPDNFDISLSPIKNVDKILILTDSRVTCETPIKSLKVNVFSSSKSDEKEVSQTVVSVCNKTPLKKSPWSSQKRVTSKSKLQKTNSKNKSKKTSQCHQTSLVSFFQSNNISSKKINKSMSVPVQTTCQSTANSSLVKESLLRTDNTIDNKSLPCSSPKVKGPKTVLSLDQFKQLFHNPTVKQKTDTTESLIPISSLSPISEDYQEKKLYFSGCPFYKKIPGTNITIDAFKYGVIQGCRAYFLTHFHYDHYQGLKKHFSQPLYCSEVTANLVKLKIGVADRYIHPLPLYCPVIVESVEVTLMDANHCPGSILILFKYSDEGRKKVVLHTGDFRADSLMEKYDALKNVKINQLYLDTTYCDPEYVFPGQQEVLDFCVSLVKSFLTENPQTLVVVGTYTIGKEKVFLALAEAIGSKIGVTQEKKRLLDCLQSITMDKLLTLDLKSCCIHVVKMSNLNYRDLNQHLRRYEKFNHLLALKPTGWTHNKNRTSLYDIKPSLKTDKITIYGIPYSEHSSFSEMKRFVQFIRPANIVPTVNNGKAASRKFMQDTFNSWLSQ